MQPGLFTARGRGRIAQPRRLEGAVSLRLQFSTASGGRHTASHAIVLRSEAGQDFDPGHGDSWVVSWEGETLTSHLKKAGWYTGVWRSGAGRVYVTDADGFVQHGSATSGPQTWEHHDLGGTLTGVWGVDDDNVFAWGLGPKGAPVLHRWDGAAWCPIAAPSQEHRVLAMHGVAPDRVLAVGQGGLAALWDGAGWTRADTGTRQGLSACYVTSDGAWATSQAGLLLRWDGTAWRAALTCEQTLASVAVWRGEVWVATWGPLGLCKWVEGALVSIKPNLQVVQLAADDALLFVTMERVGSTEDGQRFLGFHVDGTATLLRAPLRG